MVTDTNAPGTIGVVERVQRFSAVAFLCVLLPLPTTAASPRSNHVLEWNNASFQGIRDAKLGAPAVARSLAAVHTCMYDAWAAYDELAVGTQLGEALRRPASERTLANKEQAIGYAAYRAIADVLPVDRHVIEGIKSKGLDVVSLRVNRTSRTAVWVDAPTSNRRSVPKNLERVSQIARDVSK